MTGQQSKPRNRLALTAMAVGLLASLFAVLFVHLRFREYAHDDAYIHFRIARNLVEEGVPYFNPSERVMSSSATGWTMLLYLVILASRSLGSPELSLWVAVTNSLASFGGAVVYTLLLIRMERSSRVYPRHIAFFALYLSITVDSSSGLMETPVALLIVGVGFLLLFSRNRHCLLLFSAAPFFRPELTVVLLTVLIYVAVAKPFSYRDAFAPSVLGASPFVVYALWFFGTLVPHTIRAKSTVYLLSYSEAGGAMAQSWTPSLTLPLLQAPSIVFPRCFYALGTVAIGCTVALSVLRSFRHTGPRWMGAWRGIDVLFLVWGGIVLAAHLMKRTYVFAWYVPLYVVPLTFVLSRGLSAVPSQEVRLGFVVLLTFLSSGHLLGGLQRVFATANPVYYPSFGTGARVRHYLELGKRLYREYPEARLMTSEIGGLGYTFRGYILDGAGLVSPEALRYHPMKVPEERGSGKIGAIPVGFIRDQTPELIVSYDCFVRAFLESDVANGYVRFRYPIFLEDDLERTASRTFWGSRYLNVFVRKDLCSEHQSCLP